MTSLGHLLFTENAFKNGTCKMEQTEGRIFKQHYKSAAVFVAEEDVTFSILSTFIPFFFIELYLKCYSFFSVL